MDSFTSNLGDAANAARDSAHSAVEEAVEAAVRTYGAGLVTYDSARKRVWVSGQRLHHGMAGSVLAGFGLAGLLARRLTPIGGLEAAVLGTALMAHDWHDRSLWFAPGDPQED